MAVKVKKTSLEEKDLEIPDIVVTEPSSHAPPDVLPTWRLFLIISWCVRDAKIWGNTSWQHISMCVGLFMSLMDLSIISTALYTIALEFDDYKLTIWAAISYTLADIGMTRLLNARPKVTIYRFCRFLHSPIGCLRQKDDYPVVLFHVYRLLCSLRLGPKCGTAGYIPYIPRYRWRRVVFADHGRLPWALSAKVDANCRHHAWMHHRHLRSLRSRFGRRNNRSHNLEMDLLDQVSLSSAPENLPSVVLIKVVFLLVSSHLWFFSWRGPLPKPKTSKTSWTLRNSSISILLEHLSWLLGPYCLSSASRQSALEISNGRAQRSLPCWLLRWCVGFYSSPGSGSLEEKGLFLGWYHISLSGLWQTASWLQQSCMSLADPSWRP